VADNHIQFSIVVDVRRNNFFGEIVSWGKLAITKTYRISPRSGAMPSLLPTSSGFGNAPSANEVASRK
jgi:hypothetical protein